MYILIILAILFYLAIENNEKKTGKWNNFTQKMEYPLGTNTHKYDTLVGP